MNQQIGPHYRDNVTQYYRHIVVHGPYYRDNVIEYNLVTREQDGLVGVIILMVGPFQYIPPTEINGSITPDSG